MSDIVTTYTYCMKITRTDSAVLALTDLDVDVDFGGTNYLSSIGYTPSNFEATSTLSVNNSELGTYISVGGFERDDLTAGLFDFALVEIILVDYIALTKVRDIATGRLGEVEITDDAFKVEFRSLTQPLQQTIGRIYQAECDANLGDSRCGVLLASFTDTGTITSVTSNSVFVDSGFIGTQSDDYYNYGLITFTSGLNNGLKQEIKDYNDATGEFTTLLPFPFAVAVSDTFSVYAGCDKRKTTCINKFNNVINFRGFDMKPSRDQLLKAGGQ